VFQIDQKGLVVLKDSDHRGQCREEKEQDFSEVRGDFESNAVVTAVLEHIRVKQALGDELLERLRR
jgi:hypothetical protein